MQKASFSGLLAIVAAAALITQLHSAPTKEDYSGYLGDYSDLKEEKAGKGVEVMRYVSPETSRPRTTMR